MDRLVVDRLHDSLLQVVGWVPTGEDDVQPALSPFVRVVASFLGVQEAGPVAFCDIEEALLHGLHIAIDVTMVVGEDHLGVGDADRDEQLLVAPVVVTNAGLAVLGDAHADAPAIRGERFQRLGGRLACGREDGWVRGG